MTIRDLIGKTSDYVVIHDSSGVRWQGFLYEDDIEDDVLDLEIVDFNIFCHNPENTAFEECCGLSIWTV